MSPAFGNDVVVAPKLGRLRIVCQYQGNPRYPDCMGVLQEGEPAAPVAFFRCAPCWKRDLRDAQARNGLFERVGS